MDDNDNIIDSMNMDPIDIAEKVFQKDTDAFSNDEMAATIALNMLVNQTKETILKSKRDVFSSISWQEFLDVLKENGFVIGFEKKFLKYDQFDTEIIAYHKMGLVLYATSYGGNRLNGGELYFEAGSTETVNELYQTLFTIHASGGMNKDSNVMHMHFDIRNGIMWRIQEVLKYGVILPEWTEEDKFLWFVNYAEDDVPGYDYKKITNDKIALLPDEAKQIIGPRL